MNLLHMKYAVEIAETNSINKAAETLYVGQSALSRAIKELETSLGVTLFERSAKGMFLTPNGEVFIRYAKTVLKQVDAIETMFSGGNATKKRFSISVPRASYITSAFADFSNCLASDSEVEVFYKETNSLQAIKNILQEDYKLGIIRYAEDIDRYYKNMMDEKGLDYELVTEFRYVAVMNAGCPLAEKETITYDDLAPYIEVVRADPYVPTMPFAEMKKEELPDNSGRRIFVFERGSRLELLAENNAAYMWASPIPEKLLKRYGLVQRLCVDNKRIYKDVLVHRRDYRFSALDSAFVESLVRSKRETFSKEII